MDNTKLEFWDDRASSGYEALCAFIRRGHQCRGAKTQRSTTQGDRWRQPNTSLTLAPGTSQSYGFKFQWAD